MPLESDKWGWEHVSIFGGFDRGSGTKRWKCNHCNLRYNGSYSRVRAHLLGFTGVGVKSCPAIDTSLREAFHVLEQERLARKKKRVSADAKPCKRIRTSQPVFTWKSNSKEDVDDIVARFFYADGVNVNIVNSPYFQDMVKAISGFGSGYELPSTDKLSQSLLSKEKGRIEKSMNPVRESWPHTGCTLLCCRLLDSMLGLSCISIFVSSPRGLVFMKSVDLNNSNEVDDLFISSLSDTISEVGPTNVLQIISNLGDDFKSSISVVLSNFPCIFSSPCTLHSVRILIEEISEIEWVKPVVWCAKEIEQWMSTYQLSFPCNLTRNLKDSNPLISKFAPSFCLVQRISGLKQVLQELVLGEEGKRCKPNPVVESTVLGNEFWEKADILLQLYEPFVVSMLDVDKSVMGDIYDWRAKALDGVKNNPRIEMDTFRELEGLLEEKWDMFVSPLHAAGYLLNPKYFGKGQTKDKIVMRSWKFVLEKYECESSAGRRVVREQLSSYWRLEGSFGDEDAVDCRDKMDPVAWWENFGFETPQLQTLAIKVLSQVASVGICDKIWKNDDFSQRNMKDIVFVRNNLRLHSQRSGSCSVSGKRNVS